MYFLKQLHLFETQYPQLSNEQTDSYELLVLVVGVGTGVLSPLPFVLSTLISL